MTVKKSKLICLCNGVTDREILRVLKRGARNLEDVKKFTLASSGCGRCRAETEAIINLYFSGKTTDLQQIMNFKNPNDS